MSIRKSQIDEPRSFYIPGGMRPGKSLEVRGKVDYNASRFCINLQTSEEPGDGDVIFHFNPRPNENVVVRNSRVGGDWQNEEREQPCFPFDEGKIFRLKIEVTDTDYLVYVNGSYFISYSFRLEPSSARFVHFSDGAEYYDLKIQDRFSTPYQAEIAGGLSPGDSVRVRGLLKSADGFSVNFCCDDDGDEIAFHFNPRPNEGCVVRNAKLGGWGQEEREQESFPFVVDGFFDIEITATDDCFVVCVDETEYTTFQYRCDVNQVRALTVRGDVDIANIQLNKPLPETFVKRVPSGLEKGDILSFSGYFRPGGERFAINLIEGYDTDDNIAFHFNPRRGEEEVVMNNRFDGSWQTEQRDPLPEVFKGNKPFTVDIVVKSRKFKVYVNGKRFCKFLARGEVGNIRGIQVAGSVYMYSAELQRKLEKPFLAQIHGRLQPGNWIIIRGTPKKSRGRFHINLQSGTDSGSDIAFHFNPRLTENCVIRNTFQGSWGSEEREQPCFPFEKKDNFEIAINVQDGKYATFVNGDRFIEYEHRIPVDEVKFISLAGDADFQECEFF